MEMNTIHPTSIMYQPVYIGNHVSIGPYNVIGIDGMQRENGEFIKHKGSVKIGDNVIIMAFNNIGKALLPIDNTVIGNGTIIGKHNSIGHNVHIGNHVVIINHVVITGSAIIEDNVKIYNGAIIFNRVKIGHDAIIGAGSIVTKNVEPKTVVFGNPARVKRIIE